MADLPYMMKQFFNKSSSGLRFLGGKYFLTPDEFDSVAVEPSIVTVYTV